MHPDAVEEMAQELAALIETERARHDRLVARLEVLDLPVGNSQGPGDLALGVQESVDLTKDVPLVSEQVLERANQAVSDVVMIVLELAKNPREFGLTGAQVTDLLLECLQTLTSLVFHVSSPSVGASCRNGGVYRGNHPSGGDRA